MPAASTIPQSSSKYIVYQGNSSYDGSSLSIYDAATGANQVVVDNGPGATTSIAVNPRNDSVYLGIGYGTDAGDIFSFSLSQSRRLQHGKPDRLPLLRHALQSGGTGSQSGAGMFLDNNGYLFSGGDGITVFNPSGSIVYDQPAGAADNYYDALAYDPANNEVLKVPYVNSGPATGSLYNATEFETRARALNLGAVGRGRRFRPGRLAQGRT